MKLLVILACCFYSCSPAEQNYDYFVDKNPNEYDQAVYVDGADPVQGQDSQKKQNGKDGGEELPPCSEVHWNGSSFAWWNRECLKAFINKLREKRLIQMPK